MSEKHETDDEEIMDFDDVIESIKDALCGMDGDSITQAHNEICAKQITYREDSMWEYSGETDYES